MLKSKWHGGVLDLMQNDVKTTLAHYQDKRIRLQSRTALTFVWHFTHRSRRRIDEPLSPIYWTSLQKQNPKRFGLSPHCRFGPRATALESCLLSSYPATPPWMPGFQPHVYIFMHITHITQLIQHAPLSQSLLRSTYCSFMISE